jgi:hypothetical protein
MAATQQEISLLHYVDILEHILNYLHFSSDYPKLHVNCFANVRTFLLSLSRF